MLTPDAPLGNTPFPRIVDDGQVKSTAPSTVIGKLKNRKAKSRNVMMTVDGTNELIADDNNQLPPLSLFLRHQD